jgi:O-antigen/teichoic acid export membrane protein
MTILAQPLLQLLYGSSFSPAAKTLAILAWSIIPYSVVRYQAYVLLATHRQRIDLWLNVVMSLVNAGLNLALIPLYGHFGAACATLVSICLVGLLQYAYLSRALPGSVATPSISVAVIVATALAGVTAWLLRDSYVILALIMVAVIYLMSLFVGGFFNPSELKFLHLYGLLHRVGLAGKLER